jgi:signal transduction histidine kinase
MGDTGGGTIPEGTMKRADDQADRWVRGLHSFYLVTLLIALVATIPSVIIPTHLPGTVLWPVAGLAAALLAAADVVVRRWSAFRGRPARMTGYFLAVAATLGALSAVFPTFATVAFGALPLAFVLLRRLAAVAVGVVLTGLPYVLQPYAIRLLSGGGAPAGVLIRFGPVYLVMIGVALPVLTGLFTAAAIEAVHRQSRSRQAVVEQLSATRAELAAASRQAGQAEERQRLAHELHDTLAQGLSGVILQLEAAEQQLDLSTPHDESARLSGLLVKARETARGCLADTRRAVEALRPEPLDGATLADAMAHVCLQWSGTTGVPVRTTVRGQARQCHPPLEVIALRVTQEALANAGKHAAAGEVTVTIEYRAGELCLAVSDDGCGFDPAHTPHPNGYTSGGHGLATMRERVTTAGGTLTVTSTPGTGTTITATLPDLTAPIMGTRQ